MPIPEHPTIPNTYRPPKDHVYTLQYSPIPHLSFKNNRLHSITTQSIAIPPLLIDLHRSFIDQITYNTLSIIFLPKPSPPYRPGGIEKYCQIYTSHLPLQFLEPTDAPEELESIYPAIPSNAFTILSPLYKSVTYSLGFKVPPKPSFVTHCFYSTQKRGGKPRKADPLSYRKVKLLN